MGNVSPSFGVIEAARVCARFVRSAPSLGCRASKPSQAHTRPNGCNDFSCFAYASRSRFGVLSYGTQCSLSQSIISRRPILMRWLALASSGRPASPCRRRLENVPDESGFATFDKIRGLGQSFLFFTTLGPLGFDRRLQPRTRMSRFVLSRHQGTNEQTSSHCSPAVWRPSSRRSRYLRPPRHSRLLNRSARRLVTSRC